VGAGAGHDAGVEPADRSERKRRGAWYTPPAVAALLVEQAVVPAIAEGRRPLRVLDPACGDGRLLAAAAAALDPRGEAELVGIEVDAATAALAQRAVPAARILVGDGRTLDPGGPFDVVIGNPPYLGQLARATTRGGRSALGGGPYADVAAEFLARSLAVVRPDGGRVALVLPQSVLSSRDTGPIRASVRPRAAVVGFWWSPTRVFDAAVTTCVVALQVGRPQGAVRRWCGPACTPQADAPAAAVAGPSWSPLVADLAGVPSLPELVCDGRLADLATATAGFRQQFYGLVPYVRDDADGPALVTTGLIDAGRCAWGERPARFARRTFAAPRVDTRALGAADPRLAAWVDRQRMPKVLVATQTKVIEAVVDQDGDWIPSVPVIAVHPRRRVDLWSVAAVLLAPPVAAFAATQHLGAGMGAGVLKLSARQVLALPLPARGWDRATALLRAGNLDGAGVEMCRAYGLRRADADPILDWWRPRTGRMVASA
jgi:SAM-dependent methyltransferase